MVAAMSAAERDEHEDRALKMRKAMGENLADDVAGESPDARTCRLNLIKSACFPDPAITHHPFCAACSWLPQRPCMMARFGMACSSSGLPQEDLNTKGPEYALTHGVAPHEQAAHASPNCSALQKAVPEMLSWRL